MKKWENLPEFMRNEAVKPYYEKLQSHRVGIVMKRVMDVMLALILFCVLFPFMLIIGVIVGVTSPGGVFFCQERVTTYGRKFKIIKFRTMVSNAEALGSQVTTNGDSRVTGIGRFLRKVRLDELPQLINIIKGDMSIVGTRPPLISETNLYEPRHKARLAIKPGITGMWQVSGRSDITDFEEVVRLDKEYIENWDIGLDIKILLKTVMVVAKKDGSV